MKKSLKLRAVVSPTLAIIAAAYDENGKTDACTLAFYTPTSYKPPCLTIAINATAKRKTRKSVLHSGSFTIGYPGIKQVAEADYFGITSGYEHDKIAEVGWTATRAEKVNAPVINELKHSSRDIAQEGSGRLIRHAESRAVSRLESRAGVLRDEHLPEWNVRRRVAHDQPSLRQWTQTSLHEVFPARVPHPALERSAMGDIGFHFFCMSGLPAFQAWPTFSPVT